MAVDISDLDVVINNLATQLKQKKNKVTPDEWNNMWNTLIAQSNINATVLKSIKDAIDDGSLTGSTLVSYEDEPEGVDFYIKIES